MTLHPVVVMPEHISRELATGFPESPDLMPVRALEGRAINDVYRPPPGMPFDQWIKDGRTLQGIEKYIGWWLGDWLLYGKQTYGNARYSQALEATGYAYQTLRVATMTAKRFPPEKRIMGLSFTHHSEAKSLEADDAEELLVIARDEKLSTIDLRALVATRKEERAYERRLALPAPVIARPEITVGVGDAQALTLDDNTVDLIVTSPPYGVGIKYAGGDIPSSAWRPFMVDWLKEAFRVTKPGGRLALNVPLDTTEGGFRPTYAHTVIAAERAGWTYRSSIVWDKGQQGKSVARGSIDSPAAPSIIAPTEMIALFSRGEEWGRIPDLDYRPDIAREDWLEWTNGLWEIQPETSSYDGIAAAFPLELPRRLIFLLSFPGELVCDPFLGSGTTALAAQRGGRAFTGFDIDPECVASTRRRLAKG